MSLTNKEIALELTKLAVEHYSVRVTKGVQHSGLSEDNVESFYKQFYNAVTSLNSSHQES